MKFALVSHILPPARSGQAMVLFKLFRNYNTASYCLISTMRRPSDVGSVGYADKLGGKYYEIRPALKVRFCLSLMPLWNERFSIGLSILRRARKIAAIVRYEKSEVIVACTGGDDLIDLPAAFFASRLTGTHFIAYYFDHYKYQWLTDNSVWNVGKHARLARWMESKILKGSNEIIVPNEFLLTDLVRLYNVTPTIIRNPCEIDRSPLRVSKTPDYLTDQFRIVYTGAVYEAHYDAFRNLIAAIGSLDNTRVSLHLYTGQSMEDLAKHGIEGPVVFHPHMALADMPSIQREADILFLPLAFHSPYPALIRSSAPGKIGEYLSVGRPILVHAPQDSFLSWYFNLHECGFVVDQLDPTLLADAIMKMLSEPALCERVSRNALARATADFDIKAVGMKLLNVIYKPKFDARLSEAGALGR